MKTRNQAYLASLARALRLLTQPGPRVVLIGLEVGDTSHQRWADVQPMPDELMSAEVWMPDGSTEGVRPLVTHTLFAERALVRLKPAEVKRRAGRGLPQGFAGFRPVVPVCRVLAARTETLSASASAMPCRRPIRTAA